MKNGVVDTDTDTNSVTDALYTGDKSNNDDDQTIDDVKPVPPLDILPQEWKVYLLQNLSNIDYNDDNSSRRLMRWRGVLDGA